MSSAHHTPRAPATWRKADYVLDCRDGDLITLLSLHTGRYHTLDPIGALVWERLDAHATLDDLARVVIDQFDIDFDVASQDIAALLQDLHAERLVYPAAEMMPAGPAIGGTRKAAAAQDPRTPTTAAIALALARIRYLLLAGGVARATRFAYAAGACCTAPISAAVVSAVVDRVNRIATLAPFRAECLERSLTVVHALRAAGIDAKLRLAIRHYPFEAHAWAEYADAALNEAPAVCALYAPFPALEMEMLPCGR